MMILGILKNNITKSFISIASLAKNIDVTSVDIDNTRHTLDNEFIPHTSYKFTVSYVAK
jgi:hypothetical protein